MICAAVYHLLTARYRILKMSGNDEIIDYNKKPMLDVFTINNSEISFPSFVGVDKNIYSILGPHKDDLRNMPTQRAIDTMTRELLHYAIFNMHGIRNACSSNPDLIEIQKIVLMDGNEIAVIDDNNNGTIKSFADICINFLRSE